METVILVIHLILAVFLIGIILLQRNEGGMGSLGGGGGNFMSGRAAANFMTKTTTFLAIGFMCTSVMLAVIAVENNRSSSILEQLREQSQNPASVTPEEPQTPVVPLVE